MGEFVLNDLQEGDQFVSNYRQETNVRLVKLGTETEPFSPIRAWNPAVELEPWWFDVRVDLNGFIIAGKSFPFLSTWLF